MIENKEIAHVRAGNYNGWRWLIDSLSSFFQRLVPKFYDKKNLKENKQTKLETSTLNYAVNQKAKTTHQHKD